RMTLRTILRMTRQTTRQTTRPATSTPSTKTKQRTAPRGRGDVCDDLHAAARLDGNRGGDADAAPAGRPVTQGQAGGGAIHRRAAALTPRPLGRGGGATGPPAGGVDRLRHGVGRPHHGAPPGRRSTALRRPRA